MRLQQYPEIGRANRTMHLLTQRRNFRIIRCEAPRQGRDVAPRRAWARAAARAAPTLAGAAAAVRRRWRIAGPAPSPYWTVSPAGMAPPRRGFRHLRWRARAARPAAATRS